MEDSVVLHNDEVIADSEDENEIMDKLPGPAEGLAPYPTSAFSAFPPTNQHYKLNTHSSISDFTAGPSAIVDYSRIESSELGLDKEQNTDAETSIASLAAPYAYLDHITSSIADRAKTRQRPKNHSAAASLDIIELTTDDEDDELSLKPSKPRPKPKPKLTIKLKPKERAQPVDIPTTSVQTIPPPPIDTVPPRPRPRPRPIKRKVPETEAPVPFQPTSTSPSELVQADPPQSVAAPPRPRPRPRPIVKRTVLETEAPAPLPPTSTPASELPIATSSPRAMTSQLPPSDPPPSMGTAYNDDINTRVPPINVLFDGPLSSPGSLFSDSEKTSKKRKRNPPGSDQEVDQLASSQDPPQRLYPGLTIYESSPHGMPPPPTFFAGSSSSSIAREGHTADIDTFTLPPPPELNVVDLTMLPPTMVPAPKPKPKKSKKKVDLSMFDENFGGAMVVLDEDNEDDDFDPRGEGSSKKKKPKAKPKEKPVKSKSKTKPASDGVEPPSKAKVVEVLLDLRPPSKGKGKAKASDDTPTSKASDKGKKKDSTTNKEVFKSREFIESSDDELNLVQRGRPSDGSIVRSAHTISSLTSVKVNATSKVAPSVTVSRSAASSSKPKEHSPHRSLSPLSDLDSEMGDGGPPTTKRPDAKKRKSIVDSDGEDGDFAMAADEVIRVTPASATSTKKRKTGTSVKKGRGDSQKKGRSIFLSDDEEEDHREEEETVKTTKLPKASAKQSKKIIHDDDDELDTEVQQAAEQQSTPEEMKENVVPEISRSSVAPTPRSTTIPKPSMPGTNSEHKTPIYAKYEIAPRKSGLPMSELIRRANSMPGSPFPSTPSAIGPSRLKGLTRGTPLAYSPLLKSSRSMLSRIAPLHPNRRTPPPPPPPPPPRKKTKKELELEEKWEEEMVESVGGVEAWAVLGDDERREIRKAKWARELGDWDD